MKAPELDTRDRHLLLWDGECGFCRRAVERILAGDAHHEFEPIPYQEVPSPPMSPELAAACAKAVHILTRDGRVLRAGEASLFVLSRTGWPILGRLGSFWPLSFGVELGYGLVARNRRFFSKVFFKRPAQ